MFNEYDAVVRGGFIIALIFMLLNKNFYGILAVCCCQKRVDSLRALAQSVQIGELYHSDILCTEELDRADSLIHESATVSTYNIYALYDISNSSTCLISEIYNKMKVVQLVATSAAVERGWEQRQRNPEPKPADLPLPAWTATPPQQPPPSDVSSPSPSFLSVGSLSQISYPWYVGDSTSSTLSNFSKPTPINLHLHFHSPWLPQKPKEQEHEEKPNSGGPEDNKNEEKKRGNKFEKREKEKEKENMGKKKHHVRGGKKALREKKFSKGRKRENRQEEEEEARKRRCRPMSITKRRKRGLRLCPMRRRRRRPVREKLRSLRRKRISLCRVFGLLFPLRRSHCPTKKHLRRLFLLLSPLLLVGGEEALEDNGTGIKQMLQPNHISITCNKKSTSLPLVLFTANKWCNFLVLW